MTASPRGKRFCASRWAVREAGPYIMIERFLIVGDGVLDVPPPQRGGKSDALASAGGSMPRPYEKRRERRSLH